MDVLKSGCQSPIIWVQTVQPYSCIVKRMERRYGNVTWVHWGKCQSPPSEYDTVIRRRLCPPGIIMLWIQGIPFRNFIYMPQILDTFMPTGQSSVPVLTLSMHTVHSYASDFGQTFAPQALSCPGFHGTILQPLQYWVGFSHCHYHRAMLCPRFGTDFCHFETICLKFQADFCTPKAICVRFQTDLSISGAI